METMMDRVNAEKIHSHVKAIFEQTNEVLYITNNSDDLPLKRKAQQVFGMLIAELDLEILEPIYKQFPDLRPPDMDEINK